MKSLKFCVDQVSRLLDQLITIANKLVDLTLQIPPEADILQLQKQQEDLLRQISEVDQYLQDNYKRELSHAMHDKFHNKIQEFQTLNKKFVTNLKNAKGLIQFDDNRAGTELEEGEKIHYLPLLHLFKTTQPNFFAEEESTNR